MQGPGGGPDWGLSQGSSLIHVPLNPLSLPSCFVVLQFHNFRNPSTALCVLTSSILFVLVTYVLEVMTRFRNFPSPASRSASGLRASVCTAPGLTRCRFLHQSPDILSTVGYDSIIQHLNNGRKNCKEFEDFLKERYMLFPLRRQRGGQNAPIQRRNKSLFLVCVSWFMVNGLLYVMEQSPSTKWYLCPKVLRNQLER